MTNDEIYDPNMATFQQKKAYLAKNLQLAKQDSDNKSTKKKNATKEKCPLQIRIVELIEVITHNGKEYSVQGPTKKPRKTPKTIKGNIKRKDKEKGAYKQYINLDNEVEESKAHPEYGRCVRLKARIEWVSKKKKDSLAGKKVYWSSEPAPGNKTGLTGNQKEVFKSDQVSILAGYSETDDDGWTPTVRFFLSQYGGDKFRIFAQADEKNEGKGSGKKRRAGWYVVWRKIYYTLACMLRSSGSDYSNRVTEATLVSEYAKTFVKLERTGGLSKPAHKLLIEKDQSDTWSASQLPAAAARTLNVALIDTLAKGAPIPFTREADPPGNVFSWTLSGGSYAFDLSAQNKWLASARYYDKNQPFGSRILLDIPNNKVTLTLDALNYKLEVDVSGVVSGGLPLNRIHVVLNLKKRDFLSGLSWGPTTIVAMRWRECFYPGKEGDATMHTMLHESGHFLGLAPKKLPDTSQSDNSYYYDENSLGVGKGPHCSYDKPNVTIKAYLPTIPKCIMYHEFEMTMNFCTNCSNSLRARDLSSPKVNGKTAGY